MAKGGVRSTPPPMFFRPTPYPGGNLVKTKMIHEPNSFADILKKIACNFIQPFSHSNYVLKVYRGGFVQPPPKTDQRGCPRGGVHRTPPSISVVYQPISMKFSHHVTYHVSFPKNIGLALYDLYDVINDVINSKNRNFQKLLQITIFDRFWWIRMEIKA